MELPYFYLEVKTMLMIECKNEDLIIELCKNMKDCKVIVCGQNEVNNSEPVRIKGTCSDCPHFTSANAGARAGRVKWGHCEKLNANVNEERECCSLYKNERKEVRIEEREVERVHVA